MQFIRSLLFNIAFYVMTSLLAFACQFTMILPKRYLLSIVRLWGRIGPYLFTTIMGGSYEIRGKQNLPSEGAFILASKHMSVFETFALLPMTRDPLIILKRELMWIPLFGWAVAKADMIPINRSAKHKALRLIVKHAKEKMSAQRQLIIFPEGTRRPVDAEPKYKFGIAKLYDALEVPCCPVALNTGLFWPRNTFMHKGGKIIIEILPPIEPGLNPDIFFEKVSTEIETNSVRLIEEARKDDISL